jgi:rRNA processing protein Gar1
MVLAVTPTGGLTARSFDDAFPPEGTRVTDRTGRLEGRVARVFGPVKRPYLSIRLPRPPRPEDGAALVGATLLRERGKQYGQR